MKFHSYFSLQVAPYPNDEELQEQLNLHLDWQKRKVDVIKDSLKEVKKRREAKKHKHSR